MIHLGKDVKLNICPILVTLHHDYVFEGPCRMGKGFELTKEFDDMANAELIKGAREEIAENLASPHFHVMEPIWVDRNEEFLGDAQDHGGYVEGPGSSRYLPDWPHGTAQ